MRSLKSQLKYFFIIGMAASFWACGEQSNQRTTAQETETVKPPRQIIPLERAQKLYGNYSSQRAPLIRHYEDSLGMAMAEKGEEVKKFDVARYGYYDYKTIKAYMAYIEQEAARVGEEISTLRIYFGTYANQQGDVHPRQNTFMLLPTIRHNGRDYGFEISGDTPPQAILLGDSLSRQGPAQKASFIPMMLTPPQNGGSLILNEGQMVPPPYNND
jgi:hypothetical protein